MTHELEKFYRIDLMAAADAVLHCHGGDRGGACKKCTFELTRVIDKIKWESRLK